jgi:hypothetical protein
MQAVQKTALPSNCGRERWGHRRDAGYAKSGKPRTVYYRRAQHGSQRFLARDDFRNFGSASRAWVARSFMLVCECLCGTSRRPALREDHRS